MIKNSVLGFDEKTNSRLKILALSILASVLLIISAKMKVPFYPVPITLQTLFVLLIPLVYGLKISTISICLYFSYGLLGLPVFSNGGGVLYFAGPTAGYLYGFLLANFLIGYFKDKNAIKDSLVKLVLALLAGEVIIFTFGVSWLANFLGWEKAFALGLSPFIIGEVFKITIIVAVYFFITKSKYQNKF